MGPELGAPIVLLRPLANAIAARPCRGQVGLTPGRTGTVGPLLFEESNGS